MLTHHEKTIGKPLLIFMYANNPYHKIRFRKPPTHRSPPRHQDLNQHECIGGIPDDQRIKVHTKKDDIVI